MLRRVGLREVFFMGVHLYVYMEGQGGLLGMYQNTVQKHLEVKEYWNSKIISKRGIFTFQSSLLKNLQYLKDTQSLM